MRASLNRGPDNNEMQRTKRGQQGASPLIAVLADEKIMKQMLGSGRAFSVGCKHHLGALAARCHQ
jgi:hypothetical protein